MCGSRAMHAVQLTRRRTLSILTALDFSRPACNIAHQSNHPRRRRSNESSNPERANERIRSFASHCGTDDADDESPCRHARPDRRNRIEILRFT
ncbi:hypothetical protein FG484_12665 [Burkholderia pseudomallei]|nr:hypothetical protein [Burkholderia pseudomallei]